MIKYTMFYKRYGCFTPAHVKEAKRVKVTHPEWLRDVTLHYALFSEHEVGPTLSNMLFLPYKNKPINMKMVDAIYVNTSRSKPKVNAKAVRLYLRDYVKIKTIPDKKYNLREYDGLTIVNYGPINDNYLEPTSPRYQLARYDDNISTLVHNLNTNTKKGDQHQVVYIEAPEAEFEKSDVMNAKRLMTNYLTNLCTTQEQFTWIMLQRWVVGGPSPFNELTPAAVANTSLLVKVNGEYTLIAMRMLSPTRLPEDRAFPIKEIPIAVRATLLSNCHRTLLDRARANMARHELELRVTEELEQVDTIQRDLDNTPPIERKDTPPVDILMAKIEQNEDLTPPERNGFISATKASELLPSPTDKTKSFHEDVVLTSKDTDIKLQNAIIPDNPAILDKSMLSSTMDEMSSQYVNKVLDKHVNKVVSSLGKAGIVISKYEAETVTNALGAYTEYTIQCKPIGGNSSTLRFKLPKVNENGQFKANGSYYRLRSQMTDVPIRKVNSHNVICGSYFGKIDIRKSELMVDNDAAYMHKHLINASQGEHKKFTLVYNNSFKNWWKVPIVYADLSKQLGAIIAPDYTLMFDYDNRASRLNVTDEEVKRVERSGSRVLVGHYNNKDAVVVDTHDRFYRVTPDKTVLIGTIYDLVGLGNLSPPKPVINVKIMGKAMPIWVLLAYLMGMTDLLKTLGVTTKATRPGVREPDALLSLPFKDTTLHIMSATRRDLYILNGYLKFAKVGKEHPYKTYDKQDVYHLLLEDKGLTVRFTREFTLLDDMFLDPITIERLERMGEPTVFVPLMLRACELLTTSEYPDAVDTEFMLVRGYERFVGAAYNELVRSTRGYRGQINNKRKALEMSPYAVWTRITTDPAIKTVENINPLMHLKEKEIVTYVGEGGRSKETLGRNSREFHPNAVGVVSEATVDSGDTGINAYLSPNSQLKDVYGSYGSTLKRTSDNPTAAYSSPKLVAVGADGDDPKRVNFINVMAGHLIAIKGATAPYVRTGYEYVIPHRVSKMYAHAASQDGKITALDDKQVIITYKDGTADGVSLGEVFGSAEGSWYPHKIVTPFASVGDTVRKGDIVAYNQGFFQPDDLLPGKIIYRHSTVARIAMTEGPATFEDSIIVGKNLSERLATTIAKVLSIKLSFTDHVFNVVKPGDIVEPDSKLLQVEDEITNIGNRFGERDLDTLKSITNQYHVAKYNGTVNRIEVYYNGELSDMSESLAALTKASDRLLKREALTEGKPAVNGSVGSEYRIAGDSLLPNHLEVKVFLLVEVPYGTGDKAIASNQLKATASRIMDEVITTPDGKEVDGEFSYSAAAKRIVLSWMKIGIPTSLLKALPNKLGEIYYKK